MYQSLRSRGSDTLLRVFPFLQTPIFCALFFPSSCPYPLASIPLSFLRAFALLFTPLFVAGPLIPFLLFFFYRFYCMCVCTRVCSNTDSTCTGMLTDLKRDQINHCFLQTEQFSEKEGGKNILWTLLLDGEHLIWAVCLLLKTENRCLCCVHMKKYHFTILWIYIKGTFLICLIKTLKI